MATSVDPEQKMEENEADSETDAVQADSETDAVQADSKTDAVQADSETDAVQADSETDAVQADSETDAVKGDSETDAVKGDSERVAAIRNELEAINQEQMPIAYELLNDLLRKEIRRTGKRPSPPENPEFIRLDDKTIKISQKILVPVERDPEFNFVGKIVGPKGANLKQIAFENKVKLALEGKGSSKERDPEKEKELAESGKPEYEHLKEPLHVRVDAFGHPSRVWINMQGALAMLAHIIKPDEKDTAIRRYGSGRENSSKYFGPQGGFEESFGFGQPMMAPMRGRGWSMNPMMRDYAGGMSGFGKAGGRGGPRGRGRGSPY